MDERYHVLVVDDDPGVSRLLRMDFTTRGLTTTLASSPQEALAITAEGRWPDIAVLDLMLPSMSGIRLMHKLRQQRPLPAIILTARDTQADLVGGLEAGADDYVAKPFSLDELAARVHAVLRRSPSAPDRKERVLRHGDVEVNFARHFVAKRGEIVRLSRTEWAVLEHLASNAGKVVTCSALLQQLWGWDFAEDSQCARVWISRLRRKIEDDPSNPKLIRTVPSVPAGYSFAQPDVVESASVAAPDAPLEPSLSAAV